MRLHYNPRLKGPARNPRKAGNLAEAILWGELRAKKLGVQFLRQRPIGDYIVDFYCHELELAIEIDGTSHDSKIQSDILRERKLRAAGVRFLRFADSEVRTNLSGVIEAIKAFLKSSGLRPPPLKKEELYTTNS